METARKEKLLRLDSVLSDKFCILDIQDNNFQSVSPNIAAASKTGQTTANFQNILMKVTIAHLVSRFACNARVIDDASSKSTGFQCQIAVTKT